MNPREQRGLELRASRQDMPHRQGVVRTVPERQRQPLQRHPRRQLSTLHLPRLRDTQGKCKHIYAVEYTLKQEVSPNGSTTVTETVKVPYRQNWKAYNAAQSEEKGRFMVLLSDLCRTIPQPLQANGRPRLPLSDMIFAVVLKVYEGFSSRRFGVPFAQDGSCAPRSSERPVYACMTAMADQIAAAR